MTMLSELQPDELMRIRLALAKRILATRSQGQTIRDATTYFQRCILLTAAGLALAEPRIAHTSSEIKLLTAQLDATRLEVIRLKAAIAAGQITVDLPTTTSAGNKKTKKRKDDADGANSQSKASAQSSLSTAATKKGKEQISAVIADPDVRIPPIASVLDDIDLPGLFKNFGIRQTPTEMLPGTTSTSLRTCDYSLKVLCALRAIQLGSQQFNNRDAPPYLPQNDNFLSILRRNMVYLLSTLRDGVLQVCDSVDNVAVSKVHYSKVADQLESLSKVTHVSLKLFANTIAKLQELTAAQRASTLSMTTEVILSIQTMAESLARLLSSQSRCVYTSIGNDTSSIRENDVWTHICRTLSLLCESPALQANNATDENDFASFLGVSIAYTVRAVATKELQCLLHHPSVRRNLSTLTSKSERIQHLMDMAFINDATLRLCAVVKHATACMNSSGKIKTFEANVWSIKTTIEDARCIEVLAQCLACVDDNSSHRAQAGSVKTRRRNLGETAVRTLVEVFEQAIMTSGSAVVEKAFEKLLSA